MTRSSIFTLIAVVAVAGLVFGCAGMKKVSNEDQIKAQIKGLEDALKAKDVKKALTFVADDFDQPDLGDKAKLEELIQMGIDMGYTDDGTLDLTNAKFEVTGDKATAGPIDASSAAGSVTVQVEFKKVNGKWLATGGGEF